MWDLLAGSLSGATAVMLTYPLDLIRTRLAYATETTAGGTAHSTAGAAARHGVSDTIAGASSGGRQGHPAPPAQTLPQSAPASTLTAPTAQHTTTAAPPSSQATARSARPARHGSIRSMMVDTFQREGLGGLYKGVSPTLLGILPYAGGWHVCVCVFWGGGVGDLWTSG